MATKLLIHSNKERVYYWCILFVINLILPVFVGLTETEGNGRYGMLAGIVLCWFIGLVVCAYLRSLGTALRWGALFVAFNQFIPVLQIFAGSYAKSIGSQFQSHPQLEYQSLDTFMSGFLATVILILGLSYLSDNIIGSKKAPIIPPSPAKPQSPSTYSDSGHHSQH
jgi:hypothetical protein